MKRNDLHRLINAGKRMYESSLVTGALGSIGARLSTGEVAVTAEGSRLGFLNDHDILVLDGRGFVSEGVGGTPDRDVGLVTAVMAAQPGAGAVIRTWSPHATALAHRGRRKIAESASLLEDLGGVAFVPHYRMGTAGLAGAAAEALRENHVAVIENQGPVVRGVDIEDAIDRAEALEMAAKVIFLIAGDNGAAR